MLFIVTKPYKPAHVVRDYQFPFRIGLRKNTLNDVWRPLSQDDLITNLKPDLDYFAVSAKLYRLGQAIRSANLPVEGIRVAPNEIDVLEVCISDERRTELDKKNWIIFTRLLSTSFGLPVKL